MKKVFMMLAMLACASMVFTGCKKDEEEEEAQQPEGNYLMVGTQIYELTRATATYGSMSSIFYYGVSIVSADNKVTISFSDLNCTGVVKVIKEGTYVSSNSHDDITLDRGGSWYTIDAFSTLPHLADNASVTVKSYGNDVYDFTWSTTDQNGVAVKGYYKGTLVFNAQ